MNIKLGAATVATVALIATSAMAGNVVGYFFSADLSNGTNTGAIASYGAATVRSDGNPDPVPESASLGLLGLGVLGLAFVKARRG